MVKFDILGSGIIIVFDRPRKNRVNYIFVILDQQEMNKFAN